MKEKIAVVAGTPVDTAMGAEYLKEKDPEAETLFMPFSDDPRACHIFQMMDQEEKYAEMKKLFEKAISLGAKRFFIYCNSLSASFDFKKLSDDLGVFSVTPLDAYRKIAGRSGCLAVIAANNQATAGIEKAFTLENPDCYVLGTGLLCLVEDIEKGFRNEAGYDPESITERRGLSGLCRFYEENGAEALVLGCTHFPFLKKAIRKVTDLPVIDPADTMYDIISDACRS